MSAAAWTLEWQTWRAKKRALVIGTVVPLALVTPIALSNAPALHAAVVYTLLFTLFGIFGGAIPWIRDADTGWLQRVLLSGEAPWKYAAGRISAASLADAVQLAPAFLVICAATRTAPGLSLAFAAALFASLLAANTLGFLIACATRSIAEAALVCTISGLLLLHFAGVFRTPAAGSWGDVVQHALPFHYLHVIVQAVTSAAAPRPGAGAAVWALALSLAFAALATVAAGRLLERLAERHVY